MSGQLMLPRCGSCWTGLDGARTAMQMVEDVVIDPEYRGRGIGERLVAALCEELADIEIVSLFCLPERVAFYERNGFVPHGTQVMIHREAKRG